MYIFRYFIKSIPVSSMSSAQLLHIILIYPLKIIHVFIAYGAVHVLFILFGERYSIYFPTNRSYLYQNLPLVGHRLLPLLALHVQTTNNGHAHICCSITILR